MRLTKLCIPQQTPDHHCFAKTCFVVSHKMPYEEASREVTFPFSHSL
jgi:hypothetical protein